MRTEVPVLKRCCFCLPLRRGLIVWGYFKLVLDVVLLFCLSTTLYLLIIYIGVFKVNVYPHLIICIGMLLNVTGDFIIHIIFIVGAHEKDIKLLKVYYIYSLTLAVLTLLLLVVCIGIMIKSMLNELTTHYFGMMIISVLSSLFANLLVQAYIILLVRSEIIKLKNTMCFRFVNNAVEAECNLIIEDTYTEKGTSNSDEVIEVDEDCAMTTQNEVNGNYS